MDRNVAIASVLIAVIMFAWLWWLSPTAPTDPTAQERPILDTAAVVQEEEEQALIQDAGPAPVRDSLLARAQQGREETITVETDLYRAVLSTRGATLKSFTLKEYDKFDQETPVQIVDTTKAGALSLAFSTPSNELVDSRTLYFQSSVQPGTVQVTDQPVSIVFSARIGGSVLQQTYTFTPGEYEVGLAVQQGGAPLMTNEGYELTWNGGIPFTEGDAETEALNTGAYALSGGEVEYITLQDGEPVEENRLSGDVDWAAVKSKYFTAVMIPGPETRGAELIGHSRSGFREDYTVRLDMPRPESQAHAFRLYLGPMEFFRITDYDLGLYRMVDYGWDAFEWITRPLAQYFFIPLFEFLGSVIPNYGIVIILFAVIVKLLTYPLTKSSYESMARMREMQPKMEALKEKHADDPQKQQEAMIRLYKETGVNPFGGCLPMLLQYPVLIALWQFFPSAIEIRQKSFLWANDLSAPDVILDLPFTIPLYGGFVAGFTLLMGLSLVAQMKLQAQPGTANNPQMQIMTYLMPVMLFLFFNKLASGLSLYYLVFNVLSAVQQYFINKSADARREKAEAKAEADEARSGRKPKDTAQAAVFRDVNGKGDKKSKGARP